MPLSVSPGSPLSQVASQVQRLMSSVWAAGCQWSYTFPGPSRVLQSTEDARGQQDKSLLAP